VVAGVAWGRKAGRVEKVKGKKEKKKRFVLDGFTVHGRK
jgi:hypothetical protein